MQRRFFYSASAVGLSGAVSQPTAIQIPSQAGSVLGPSGGTGTSQVAHFASGSLVSFTQASTEVAGFRDDNGFYQTLARVNVEGLDIIGVVKVDRISCQLTAQTNDQQAEHLILASETKVENFRVNGKPVSFTWEPSLLTQFSTYRSVLDRAQSDKAFRKRNIIGFEDAEEGSSRDRPPILCTIVREIESQGAPVKVDRSGIEIEDFGRLFIGEMLIRPESRSLTMLRFQLGSPVVGHFTAASAMANGVRYP